MCYTDLTYSRYQIMSMESVYFVKSVYKITLSSCTLAPPTVTFMLRIMIKTLLMVLSLVLLTPFQLAFGAQNFAQIKTQATLSADTYLTPSELKKSLQKQGQTLIHEATLPSSQVSYFLSQKKGIQTIAIRGTDNLENAMLDLDLELKLDPTLGIKLHQGFDSAAKAVYDNIKPYLVKNQPIHITGHSLGGAIAVVLAMYLEKGHYPIGQIITFGQPKVTNVVGTTKFSDLPLIRVVTFDDIVPLVPPISPMQIKDLDIYWHMGKEIILEGNKTYAETSGLKSMLRATKFTSSIPNEKNLQAHMMVTYLKLIDGLQTDPIEVPYKADIKLFGISID